MQHINKKIIQFFSVLSDETRLRILLSLVERSKTVNQIYSDIGKDRMTLSAISHQLKDLVNLDIVNYEKKGREKILHLSNAFCWCILKDAFNHFHDAKKCPACSKFRKQKKHYEI